MGIELHGEADIGVPCQHLGGLGYDVGVAQVGDKCVTQGVEVGELVIGILIFEEVARLAFFLLALSCLFSMAYNVTVFILTFDR